MPETKRADREQTKQVKAQTNLKKKDGNGSKKKKSPKNSEKKDQNSQSQKRSTGKSSTSKEKKNLSSLLIGGFFSGRNKKHGSSAFLEEQEYSKKVLEDTQMLFQTPAPLGDEIAVRDNGEPDVHETNSLLTWSIADETKFLRRQAKMNYG
jgi:hypothetical protein